MSSSNSVLLTVEIYDPETVADEAIKTGLMLSEPDEEGNIKALNGYGAGLRKDRIDGTTSKEFLRIATQNANLLDIGCGYGDACYVALSNSLSSCSALDLEGNHLKILSRRVKEDYPAKLKSLKLIAARIPLPNDATVFKDESFDAILAEFILHYLSPCELFEALHQIRTWLKPTGKLLVKLPSYLHGMVLETTQNELNNKTQQILECKSCETNELIDMLNDFYQKPETFANYEKHSREIEKYLKTDLSYLLLNADLTKYIFEQNGFLIEQCVYEGVYSPYDDITIFAKKKFEG